MRLSLKRMELDAEAVDYTKKLLFIKRLNIVEPSFSLSTYTGTRPHPALGKTEPVIDNPAVAILLWNKIGVDLQSQRDLPE